jgi:hypothetical protein
MPSIPMAVMAEEFLIWHLTEERLIAFDLDGNELFRRQGRFDEVEITEQDRAALCASLAIVTHNHPLDVSFSKRDVNMACSCRIAMLRAISPSFIYTLQSPKDGWESDLCSALFERGGVVEAEVATGLRTAVDAGELSDVQATQEYMHRIWLRLASEFNFGYWREALPTS